MVISDIHYTWPVLSKMVTQDFRDSFVSDFWRYKIFTGSVAQWSERLIVKRFSQRRVDSNSTVSHSKGLKQVTHSILQQSTQLCMSVQDSSLGKIGKV